MSQSAVTTIQQDETAALWIGTQDGLNRFDGHSFETFSTITNDNIPNNYIKTSIKSSDKKLWFGTQDGVFNYNPYSEKFNTFSHNLSSALQVESLVETQDGKIWVGSYNNGIFFIDKNSSKITPFISGDAVKNSSLIFILNSQELGVIASGKLLKINISSKKITKSNILTDKEITAVLSYTKSSLLLGTNKGLFLYNILTNAVNPYKSTLFAQEEIKSLSGDLENLLIGTTSNGLYVLPRNSDDVVNAKKDRLNKNSLPDNTINAIFKDRFDVVWLGTNNGISNFNIYQNNFNLITTSEYASAGLPSSNVWCFEENIDGRIIFVGTDNYVSFFNHAIKKFTHCPLETVVNGKKQPVRDASISDIEYVNENLVLVSTTNGLFKLFFNDGNPFFKKIPIKGAVNDINSNKIYKVVHWKGDVYFLGTRDGVIKYNIATNHSQFYYYDPKKANSTITAGICRYIFKDNNGDVHFFTSEGGMSTYRTDKDIISPSSYNNLILSKSKEFITSAIQINHVFWLGTLGGGLLKLDTKTKKITQINHRNGLPNNVIYGVLTDNNQNLWMSSNKGLFKLNTKNNQITSYKNFGSFLLTEYNLGASLRTKQGELFFGGVNGYNFFNPDKVQKSERNTPVSIISLTVGNDVVHPEENGIITQSIDFVNELLLGYRQNNISFHIMAQDLGNANLIKYKYILEGDNVDEVFLNNQNIIHFSNLKPGDYTLKIYAQAGDSDWSKTPKIIHIKVKAPFWMSAWFWIIISISGAFFTLVYVRIRIERSRREQVFLEMKIAERTREIRKQNKEIEVFGKTIEEKNKSLSQQKELLELEKSKTDKILKNILPEMTFNELKEKGKVSARSYKMVSVMFTDFVGFTKVSEKLTPTDIISNLDFYFSEFDKIIVKNNLEKIKTIGDAYMCAGGVPIRNKANPIDMCLAALQIQQFMRKTKEERGDDAWQLRIGINTGEIIAGVIGKKKLAYDIWGSTVNVANRIEIAGRPGEVTISGETYKHIQHYFECDFKEKAVSKYNEVIDVYVVKRIKPELSLEEEGITPNEKFRELVNLHLFSSINYAKAEEFVVKLLKEKLSPHLHYHSMSHTFDVVAAAERLAIAEGITDENLFLLKSAALFHDAGFVEKYDHNEPVGARMAEEILPNYGYSPKQIDVIKQLIFVTQIPHKPTNLLEQIICDADLDYLGRPDFFEIGDRLRRELRENNKINSDRKWDELQVSFLSQHKYFTQTAINTRREQKQKHLEKVKMRLETYRYKD